MVDSPALYVNEWLSWVLSPGLPSFLTSELGGLPFCLQMIAAFPCVPLQVVPPWLSPCPPPVMCVFFFFYHTCCFLVSLFIFLSLSRVSKGQEEENKWSSVLTPAEQSLPGLFFLEQEWQWKSLERGFFETGSMVTLHAMGWALCVTPDLGTGSPSSGSGDPHTD